jgi:hypothetical protein
MSDRQRIAGRTIDQSINQSVGGEALSWTRPAPLQQQFTACALVIHQ